MLADISAPCLGAHGAESLGSRPERGQTAKALRLNLALASRAQADLAERSTFGDRVIGAFRPGGDPITARNPLTPPPLTPTWEMAAKSVLSPRAHRAVNYGLPNRAATGLIGGPTQLPNPNSAAGIYRQSAKMLAPAGTGRAGFEAPP